MICEKCGHRSGPFDPNLAGELTARAISGLWHIEPGLYPRVRLAEAMAAASGLSVKWLEAGVLRYAGKQRQLPQRHMTVGSRHLVVLELSPRLLAEAFPRFKPFEPLVPAIEPLAERAPSEVSPRVDQ